MLFILLSGYVNSRKLEESPIVPSSRSSHTQINVPSYKHICVNNFHTFSLIYLKSFLHFSNTSLQIITTTYYVLFCYLYSVPLCCSVYCLCVSACCTRCPRGLRRGSAPSRCWDCGLESCRVMDVCVL